MFEHCRRPDHEYPISSPMSLRFWDNRTADQILCFRDIDSRIPILLNPKVHLTQSDFLMDLFGNPKDAFLSRRGSNKSGVKGDAHNMDMFAAIYVSDARVDLGTAGHRL